jgi:hypothetical protein
VVHCSLSAPLSRAAPDAEHALVQLKTIEGALGRYSIGMSPEQYQTKDPTTHMKTLRTLYERHTGQQMADAFGDMLWLNPDTLREPQKGAKLAYLYDSSQGESQKMQLAPATRRKYLENARSIVYSAAVFLEALPGDAHRDQYAQLAKNFQAFGPELRELRASEKIRVGAGQLSDDDRRRPPASAVSTALDVNGRIQDARQCRRIVTEVRVA